MFRPNKAAITRAHQLVKQQLLLKRRTLELRYRKLGKGPPLNPPGEVTGCQPTSSPHTRYVEFAKSCRHQPDDWQPTHDKCCAFDRYKWEE
jgi:hypothetical protein